MTWATTRASDSRGPGLSPAVSFLTLYVIGSLYASVSSSMLWILLGQTWGLRWLWDACGPSAEGPAAVGTSDMERTTQPPRT